MRLCKLKKNFIMCLFILCLILGAMCVDKIQVDLLCFDNGVSATGNTTLTSLNVSAHNLWSLEDVLIQQPNVRPLLNLKRENMRVSLRIFTYLWSAILFLQITLACLWRQERRLWAAAESHGRIICFIHQKDGEKEEHILSVC